MASCSGGSFSGAVAHPMMQAARVIEEALDDIKGVETIFMSTSGKAAALLAFDALADRVGSVRLGLLAAAEDVAAEDGARTPAAWLAPRARRDRLAVAADEHLAAGLAGWPVLGAAVAEGAVNLDQARVILGALAVLPAELVGPEVLADAEAHLVTQAADFGPRELRNLGRHLLLVVAPEQVEEAERRRIEAEMERARTRTRLTLKPNSDGTTRLSATLPDAAAERLKQYLDAIASPRRNPDIAEGVPSCGDAPAGEPAPTRAGYATLDPATGRRIPADQVRGHALIALLEHLDPARLPDHGGLATQVVVTIDYETLLGKLGAATLASGGTITAGEARRLACAHGILPAVLGGRSEVLDLGRAQRFFNASQRKALALGHPACQGEGCDVPAAQCEFHHGRDPWSHGGRTDLADGMVLCSWHHHRIHDPAYEQSRLPNGDVRFHRRR